MRSREIMALSLFLALWATFKIVPLPIFSSYVDLILAEALIYPWLPRRIRWITNSYLFGMCLIFTGQLWPAFREILLREYPEAGPEFINLIGPPVTVFYLWLMFWYQRTFLIKKFKELRIYDRARV